MRAAMFYLLVFLLFTECSQRYVVTRLPHNGKPYYIDTEVCPRYFSSANKDEIECANGRSVKNGITLMPMSEEVCRSYLYEKT